MRLQIFNPRKKWLKRVQPRRAFVNKPTGIKGSYGTVGEIPFTAVEAEAKVDERRGIGGVGPFRRMIEDSLAAIAVARPFVKNKRSQEDRAQVLDAFQERIGQEINAHCLARNSREGRTKLQSASGGPAQVPGYDFHEEITRDELAGYVHENRFWHRQPDKQGRPRRDHFIGQDSDVTRVIPKLNDIIHSVVSAQELGLRFSTHYLDEFYSADCGNLTGLVTVNLPSQCRF